MSHSQQRPLAEVKNRLSEVIDRVEREHGRVVITRHGRPAAVILSVEDLESLEETLAVLSNAELVRQIREADEDIAEARTQLLTAEQARALMRRR